MNQFVENETEIFTEPFEKKNYFGFGRSLKYITYTYPTYI